ncbi:hypothetical protein Tco_0982653 [Tanacetum coccineum]
MNLISVLLMNSLKLNRSLIKWIVVWEHVSWLCETKSFGGKSRREEERLDCERWICGLDQVIANDIMNAAVNSFLNMNVNESVICVSCDKRVELDAELSKTQCAYNELLKRFSKLEKHSISLELSLQLNQEVFQMEPSRVNQEVCLSLPEYFEVNTLKAQLQAKDITIHKLKDRIKSLNAQISGENVKMDSGELETINIELEYSVAKLLSEYEKLQKDHERLQYDFKEQYDSIKTTRVQNKEQSDYFKNQLQEKVFAIATLKNELRQVKGKIVVEFVIFKPTATTIAPGMYKLDLEKLNPRLLNNEEAHQEYMKLTLKQADTIKDIVEQAKAVRPLDSSLEYACKYIKHIQELLVNVSKTCPNNKSRGKRVESRASSDSNSHVLSSTGVTTSTSDSGSQPSGNTKKNRISRTSSSNEKNKVEAQPKNVNQMNRVEKRACNANVNLAVKNANSVSICVTCKKCLFDANHDACFNKFVSDLNVSSKSKYAKKIKCQNIWKPMGRIFTDVGLKWKPTGRLFTLVDNACPLTRITSTTVVPSKKTTPQSVDNPKPELLVYSRIPKQTKM